MARVLRGDIRWADLNPVRGKEQSGIRPVLIISQEIFNQKSQTVIAMSITSQKQRAGLPLAIEIESTRLPKRSWLKISQVRTLSMERIGKKIDTLSSGEMEAIVEGLNEIINP